MTRGPEDGQIARAKDLALDLLEVVRSEWQKAKNMLDQQMGMVNPQAAYAAYYGYSAGAPAPPPPSGEAPPPPSEAPPPPPPDGQCYQSIRIPYLMFSLGQPPPPPPSGPAPGPATAPTTAAAYMEQYNRYWLV